MKKMLVCLIVGLFTGAALADEAGQSRTSASATGHLDKPFGAYVGVGNPYPSILGLNAAYNVLPNLRATAGYGEIEVTTSMTFSNNGVTSEKVTAKTYGAGVDYLILDSSFTPVVGVHGGYFDVKGKGTFSVQGFDKSTALAYANAGIDWTADGGFNLGAGLNVALLGGRGANFYGNVGYFF